MACNLSVTFATEPVNWYQDYKTNVVDTSMSCQIICHMIFLNDNALSLRCRVADNIKKMLTKGEEDYALAFRILRFGGHSNSPKRIFKSVKACSPIGQGELVKR